MLQKLIDRRTQTINATASDHSIAVGYVGGSLDNLPAIPGAGPQGHMADSEKALAALMRALITKGIITTDHEGALHDVLAETERRALIALKAQQDMEKA
jgi:uncharacterized Rossmann fold enzyme